MKDKDALAPWIKRFLMEYLPADRNFARNTQHSYRDALRMLVIFAGATHEPAVGLAERLVGAMPAGLTRVFYSDNGSTAVEVARPAPTSL